MEIVFMKGTSDPQGLVVADRPFFTTKERLDDQLSLSSVNLAHGDLSVARYRRDRPGLGVTTPNPIASMFMACVFLRPRPAHAGWCDGRTIDVAETRVGSLNCLDLRQPWTFDLSQPFDSFHAYIPMTAFDEVAADLKRPKIEHLSCPIGANSHDETMLGLARALNPFLANPGEATTLFTDHVFSAMVTHLAFTYGGLNPSDAQIDEPKRRGTLSSAQHGLVTGRLLDNLKDDPGVAELALLCGLSRSHFVKSFKKTTGLPPHQWLLMQRADRAKTLLVNSALPISRVASECGFVDQSHLTRVFAKVFGITPAALRRQYQD
jgi:AraC family transcriptional regulator